MNLPNSLTVLRIILVPVIIICLIQGQYLNALVLFVVAGITDALDGFFARVLEQKSVLGSYLDPLADKALIASSFITLSIIGDMPAWLTVIVISRDFIILLGILVLTLLSVTFEVRPTGISKLTTAFQLFAVLMTLLFASFPLHLDKGCIFVVYWCTALLTVASGFIYILRGLRMLNSAPPRA